ncbi:MAG: hypothetical protein JWO08_2252, partial [Verrucomicrobiaceae bacterium]|nr:hypothetical protein [Verrucomicrobiaceae bacterium]
MMNSKDGLFDDMKIWTPSLRVGQHHAGLCLPACKYKQATHSHT